MNLTENGDTQMVEWLKDNSCLYDKSHKDYRNKAKKDRMWEEQAAALDRPIGKLQQWYDSQWSNYGRLKAQQEKSGSAATATSSDYTIRKNWCLENFNFLQDFVRLQQKCRKQKSLDPDLDMASSTSQEEDTLDRFLKEHTFSTPSKAKKTQPKGLEEVRRKQDALH